MIKVEKPAEELMERWSRWMKWFKGINNRQIRLTEERQEHIKADHPEIIITAYFTDTIKRGDRLWEKR